MQATHEDPQKHQIPPPGMRPGNLAEPWPQGSDRRPAALLRGLLAAARPAVSGARGRPGNLLLLRPLPHGCCVGDQEEWEKALMAKEEEHEKRMLELNRRVRNDLPLTQGRVGRGKRGRNFFEAARAPRAALVRQWTHEHALVLGALEEFLRTWKN